jgi:putative SOS response-associated peptidase YedK
MCGRFGLPGDHDAMKLAFDVSTDLQSDIDWAGLMPRYNIAPTDQVPVILERDGSRQAGPMRWGLMPFRTTSMRGRTALGSNGKSLNTPINARAETVQSNGMFKRSFERRRCIIPAGGFYEWKRDGGAKTPYWIGLKDGPWMGFAGLYTWWKSPDGQWVPSCTIITTSPNSFIEPIHDRMPVILTQGSYDLWLSTEATDQSELRELLVPYPADEMQAHRVSSLVNSPANDGPELLNIVS